MKDDNENEDDSTKQIRLACSEKEAGELTSIGRKVSRYCKGSSPLKRPWELPSKRYVS